MGSSTLNRGGVRLQRKRGSRHTFSWHAPQHNQERRIVMDPTTVFCPNLACPARGQTGQGHIGIHAQKEQRFICRACHKTFSATQGTACSRLRTAAETVALVEQPRDLGQGHADAIRVKKQGGIGWMALAMMVKTRVWLGGEVSEQRDR